MLILTGLRQVSLLMSLTSQACHHCLLGMVQNKSFHLCSKEQTAVRLRHTMLGHGNFDSPGAICILQPESCWILDICSPPLPITANECLINAALLMSFKQVFKSI